MCLACVIYNDADVFSRYQYFKSDKQKDGEMMEPYRGHADRAFALGQSTLFLGFFGLSFGGYFGVLLLGFAFVSSLRPR